MTLTVNTIKELTKTTKSTKPTRRSREEGTPEKQKTERSPQKKKSKADEGKGSSDKEQKDESEINFSVQVMGIMLFKEDLESLDKGQYMTDTIMDLFTYSNIRESIPKRNKGKKHNACEDCSSIFVTNRKET